MWKDITFLLSGNMFWINPKWLPTERWNFVYIWTCIHTNTNAFYCIYATFLQPLTLWYYKNYTWDVRSIFLYWCLMQHTFCGFLGNSVYIHVYKLWPDSCHQCPLRCLAFSCILQSFSLNLNTPLSTRQTDFFSLFLASSCLFSLLNKWPFL